MPDRGCRVARYRQTLTAFISRTGTVFFNDTAATEIYTLSLHGALPIFIGRRIIVDLSNSDVDRRGCALRIGSPVGRAVVTDVIVKARRTIVVCIRGVIDLTGCQPYISVSVGRRDD